MSDRVGGKTNHLGMLSAITAMGVAAILLWQFRPLFQDLLYYIYTTPVWWAWIPLCLALYWVIDRRDANYARTIVGVFFLAGFLGLPLVAGFVGEQKLGTDTVTRADAAAELPDPDESPPRIVTKSVADSYVVRQLDTSKYDVVPDGISMQNGTAHWTYALVPDGTVGYLTTPQQGAVMVNTTHRQASVQRTMGTVENGIGTVFYKQYRWKLRKQGPYLASYDDPDMVVANGTQYFVVPYVEPQFHWSPLPHTTPTWGGVLLLDSDGTVQDLTPREARVHPALDGQPIYPSQLVSRRVQATRHRRGIVNTLTTHRNQTELPSIPGRDDTKPFAIMTDAGPKYLMVTEPHGNDRGIREIWLIDAQTGEIARHTPNTTQFGPRQSLGIVQNTARTRNWDRYDAIDPLPVMVDEQLYWQVRIVPEDHSRVTSIAFVNANSGRVTELDRTKAISRFLQQGRKPPRLHRTGDGLTASDSSALVVKRVGTDGNVTDRLRVPSNQSLKIVRANDTRDR